MRVSKKRYFQKECVKELATLRTLINIAAYKEYFLAFWKNRHDTAKLSEAYYDIMSEVEEINYNKYLGHYYG